MGSRRLCADRNGPKKNTAMNRSFPLLLANPQPQNTTTMTSSLTITPIFKVSGACKRKGSTPHRALTKSPGDDPNSDNSVQMEPVDLSVRSSDLETHHQLHHHHHNNNNNNFVVDLSLKRPPNSVEASPNSSPASPPQEGGISSSEAAALLSLETMKRFGLTTQELVNSFVAIAASLASYLRPHRAAKSPRRRRKIRPPPASRGDAYTSAISPTAIRFTPKVRT